MKKPKVLVTQKIFPETLEYLNPHFELKALKNTKPLPLFQLIRHAKDCDGILSFLTDGLSGKALGRLPKLKIVSNFAVGYNNIDVEAATRGGIFVTNTPSVLTEATADLAWALTLALIRNIPQADRYLRSGKFHGWRPDLFLGMDLPGKTLGIIGMGRIGIAVGRRAKAFGMKIIYHDSQVNARAELELQCPLVSLHELLAISDIVTLHAALTKETRHLIGQKEFALMKQSAYLINTARGPIVDEKALVKALMIKQIAGAGLDVYENEPKLSNGLSRLKNTILLPHIASAARETRLHMARIAAENLVAFFQGKIPPPNCVNPQTPSLF